MVLRLLEKQERCLFRTSLIEGYASLHHALGSSAYVSIGDVSETYNKVPLPRLAGAPVCSEIHVTDSSETGRKERAAHSTKGVIGIPCVKHGASALSKGHLLFLAKAVQKGTNCALVGVTATPLSGGVDYNGADGQVSRCNSRSREGHPRRIVILDGQTLESVGGKPLEFLPELFVKSKGKGKTAGFVAFRVDRARQFVEFALVLPGQIDFDENHR